MGRKSSEALVKLHESATSVATTQPARHIFCFGVSAAERRDDVL